MQKVSIRLPKFTGTLCPIPWAVILLGAFLVLELLKHSNIIWLIVAPVQPGSPSRGECIHTHTHTHTHTHSCAHRASYCFRHPYSSPLSFSQTPPTLPAIKSSHTAEMEFYSLPWPGDRSFLLYFRCIQISFTDQHWQILKTLETFVHWVLLKLRMDMRLD